VKGALLLLGRTRGVVVPALVVIVQVALLPEGQAALDAHERLLLGVDELVPRQLGLDAELLRAHVARVILLAGVRGHVGQHFLSAAESFAAVRARVRELVRVQLAVNVQRGLGPERLAARIADVGPFASMRASMILPRRLRSERAAAQVAREVLQLRVHVLQVTTESSRVAELLAAHVTRERSLVLVDPHVAQIRVLQLEALAALGAPKRLLLLPGSPATSDRLLRSLAFARGIRRIASGIHRVVRDPIVLAFLEVALNEVARPVRLVISRDAFLFARADGRSRRIVIPMQLARLFGDRLF